MDEIRKLLESSDSVDKVVDKLLESPVSSMLSKVKKIADNTFIDFDGKTMTVSSFNEKDIEDNKDKITEFFDLENIEVSRVRLEERNDMGVTRYDYVVTLKYSLEEDV